MANIRGKVAAFNPYYERVLNVIKSGAEKDAISLFSSDQYSVNLEIEYVFEDRMMYKITPLNWAVRFNKPALCKYLLDHGARPYCNLVYEYYPLHEACCRGFDQIVIIFIEVKCDLNKTTPTDRDTPLHIACVRGNVGCVNLLLKANANPNVRNAAGHTPLEAAVYNNQDDLVKLFAAYGISSPSVTTNGSVPFSPSPSSGHTPLRSHAQIQRRHSLSSPTHMNNVVQRVLSTVRPHSRPNSVLISDTESGSDSRPPSRIAVVAQNGTVSQPTTIISPPRRKDSLSSYVRTTAPSILSHPITHEEVGFKDPPRPTYFSQLSIASPSSANSPSPVERDCGLLTVSSTRNHSPLKAQTQSYYSMPSKSTTSHDHTIGFSSAMPSVQHGGVSYNPTNHTRLVDTAHSCKSSPGVESTTINITPAVPLTNHKRPQRTLKGLQHAASLDSTISYGPSSSSEFPLMATTHIYCDRTKKSGDETSDRALSLPQTTAPVESLTPSPSRERINSLAHFLTNSFEDHFTSSSKEPTSSVAQKLSEEVAQMVNLTPKELDSIKKLAISEPPSTKPVGPPDLLSETPLFSTGATDHPAEALREVGLSIEDHPREIRMCDPLPGYMSVVFKMRSNQQSLYKKDTDWSAKQISEIVKVIVQVFNLRNPADSNMYHSIDDQYLCTDTSKPHLKEVTILQHLSGSPHPNIVRLMSHFKANVSNQYDRFARQARPDNHEELYVTKGEADFFVLTASSVSLQRYFDEQRSSLFCGLSETKVLTVLAQVLLATAHLNYNGISHNAIHPENVFVDISDRDTVRISNFGNAFFVDNMSHEELSNLKQKLRVDLTGDSTFCRVSPEVKETLLGTELGSFSSSVDSDLPSLFQMSDSYAAAQMMYELILGQTHKFIRELGVSCYSVDHIPFLSGLSSLSNHLLKSLFAYEATNRMPSLEGAVASLVLLFGPLPSQVSSVQHCKEWLLAETVEFYLRPFLKDSLNSDYDDSLAKLLCVYLTLGNADPNLVWGACKFFQECNK